MQKRSKEEWKRIRRIHNAVKISFCMLLLIGTVGTMKLLTGVVEGFYEEQRSASEELAGVKTASTDPAMVPVAASDRTVETSTTTETQHNFTVCVDAGHGGNDSGCDNGNRTEAVDVLKMAETLQKELESRGVTVVMTRSTDIYVELEDRVEIANQAEADYFVSIHRNKGAGYGVETWISQNPSEEGKTLGTNIHDALVDVGVQRDRGLKEGSQDGNGNYYVIRCSKMPACLIEMGFINDPTDNDYFDSNMAEYAKAIADGIEETAKTYDKEQE